MKEPPVHRRPIQSPERPPIGIRQNSLTPKLARNSAKPRSNLLQRLIPGNTLPDPLRKSKCGDRGECGDSRPRLSRSEAPALYGLGTGAYRPLSPNPPHRIEHPIRRIHPIQILRHLGAQKAPRHRMLRIPLNPRGPPLLNSNQHPARIGTVVRTRGLNNLLHKLVRLYGASPKGVRPAAGLASGPARPVSTKGAWEACA